MKPLVNQAFRYTFPRDTVTNVSLPAGLYTHDFRGTNLVMQVDKFGEVRVANETPCQNVPKLAQEIVKMVPKFVELVNAKYELLATTETVLKVIKVASGKSSSYVMRVSPKRLILSSDSKKALRVSEQNALNTIEQIKREKPQVFDDESGSKGFLCGVSRTTKRYVDVDDLTFTVE
jgi:hypothetical protein